MVTPLSWLERVPTYKEAMENITNKDLHTYGFLGYPVLQTADIVMYGEPDRELIVPVGEDQAVHVELSREIVRRLNLFYGLEVLPDLWLPEQFVSRRALIDRLGITGVSPTTSNPEDKARTVSEVRRRAVEMGLDNFLGFIGNCLNTLDTFRCCASLVCCSRPRRVCRGLMDARCPRATAIPSALAKRMTRFARKRK